MSKYYSDTAYIPFLENLLSCLISGAWYKCTIVFLDANNSNKKEQPRPPGFSPTRIQISQICNVRLVFFIASVLLTLGVCVAKYRANIIHHFIIVFVIHFSYYSSWRSLSFARKSVSESIWAAKSCESYFRSYSRLRLRHNPRLTPFPAKSFASHFRFR